MQYETLIACPPLARRRMPWRRPGRVRPPCCTAQRSILFIASIKNTH